MQRALSGICNAPDALASAGLFAAKSAICRSALPGKAVSRALHSFHKAPAAASQGHESTSTFMPDKIPIIKALFPVGDADHTSS